MKIIIAIAAALAALGIYFFTGSSTPSARTLELNHSSQIEQPTTASQTKEMGSSRVEHVDNDRATVLSRDWDIDKYYIKKEVDGIPTTMLDPEHRWWHDEEVLAQVQKEALIELDGINARRAAGLKKDPAANIFNRLESRLTERPNFVPPVLQNFDQNAFIGLDNGTRLELSYLAQRSASTYQDFASSNDPIDTGLYGFILKNTPEDLPPSVLYSCLRGNKTDQLSPENASALNSYYWDYSLERAEYNNSIYALSQSVLSATNKLGIPSTLVSTVHDWPHVFPDDAWRYDNMQASQRNYVNHVTTIAHQ